MLKNKYKIVLWINFHFLLNLYFVTYGILVAEIINLFSEEKLMGAVLPFVIASCRWTLKVFNKEIQAAASLSLAKFMLLRSVF